VALTRSEAAPARHGSVHVLWVGLLAVLPVLVVLEGWVRIPVMPVLPAPRALAAARGPAVVLPSAWTTDSRVMFWTSQTGFTQVGNGQSGIVPTSLIVLRSQTRGFPDAASVAYLRATGFRSVVMVRAAGSGAPPGPSPADTTLGLTRADYGDSVLYTL
jgi:hypothetical protein